VLLCAPIAAAAEREPAARTPSALRSAIEGVLDALDLVDAAAAYRAIAMARPGGLGKVDAHDVHAPPSIDLRSAMRLAADRDSVARQYAQGHADLFDVGLEAAGVFDAFDDAAAVRATQSVFLAFLARWPDSHIVRKLGAAMAQTVMSQAPPWLDRARAGAPLHDDIGFAAWDEDLKRAGVNPGTTADLTVATLMLACLLTP
jgi:triphosphoribosyl-dephospho-CoA synthase